MNVIVIRKAFRRHRVELLNTAAAPVAVAAPLAEYKASRDALVLMQWVLLLRQQARQARRGRNFATSPLARLALTA